MAAAHGSLDASEGRFSRPFTPSATPTPTHPHPHPHTHTHTHFTHPGVNIVLLGHIARYYTTLCLEKHLHNYRKLLCCRGPILPQKTPLFPRPFTPLNANTVFQSPFRRQPGTRNTTFFFTTNTTLCEFNPSPCVQVGGIFKRFQTLQDIVQVCHAYTGQQHTQIHPHTVTPHTTQPGRRTAPAQPPRD